MPETKQKRASGSAYIAPPVQRAVRLIRHIADGNPVVNMSETAKLLKINRTTLLRLLHTLEVEGFVERRPSGDGYQVGLSFLGVAARALFSQDMVQASIPILTRLAENLQLSSHFGILDGTEILYLVRRTPNTPLASNVRVGSRLPAHATTMGRVILAFMTESEIDGLYKDKTLERFSERTVTSLSALHRQAASDREAGIAWSDAFFENNISSAAVPVLDFAGSPVGAINVSGPVSTFADPQRRQIIGDELKRAGHEISSRLGWIAPDAGATETAKSLVRAV